jgi:hypothetical protein
MNVLLMALVSCIYNIVHYLVIPYSKRAQFNSIVEILRTDVLILITIYYLRCASEEILRRRSYLIYKQCLGIFFIGTTVIMTSGGVLVFIKIENGLSSKDLCLELEYLSFKWGPTISSLFLLILGIHLRLLLSYKNRKYKRKLLK